jgi:Domain of unknown function (DUF4159)
VKEATLALLGSALLAGASLAAVTRAVPASAPDLAAQVALAGFPTARIQPASQFPTTPYNGKFVFTRIQYEVGGFGGGFGSFRGRRGEPPWHHDHPSAEYNFAKILETVTFVPPSLQSSNVLTLDDERIFAYPIIYMVEPGFWDPTEKELENLRSYLLKGGFMIFDDFDDQQMWVLSEIMRRVLPENPFVQLEPGDHVFESFFSIDPRTLTFQGAAYRGDQIDFWGIYEDNDKRKRLLVVAGNNGDLGEFWEFSDVGYFPIDITNEAYKVGVNYVVYGMTH